MENDMDDATKALLMEVANDFETEGCQGMGTVSVATMNKVRKALGWEPLDVEDEVFNNFYRCPCGETWESKWSCACNDRCPKCNQEIEPYQSEPPAGDTDGKS